MTPCFNEEENVRLLYQKVKDVFAGMPQYSYEHIFIDNASTDRTADILREIAAQDRRVKVIINMRNFGHIRSPYHALLQAKGDAVIGLACDLQDPPELIPELIKHWEEGNKLVVAVKSSSKENPLVYALRTLYYRVLNKLSEAPLVENFTGFGLYDKAVIKELRKVDDRYPYVRGLVAELGFTSCKVPYVQPKRQHGKTHLNLYHLFDMAMLGLTSHSIVPMRLATITGLVFAVISLLVSFYYLIYKLLHWHEFSAGMAPVLVGFFFMFSIQLMFIGLLGEYVGATHIQSLKRPLVVERERINFDTDS